MENATGLYFKVVDSDDWVNPEAYQKILNVLAEVVRGPKTLDLLISNYVYEKEGSQEKTCDALCEIAAGRPLFRMG